MTSSLLSGAIERNLNIIVSSKPGYGVVNSMLSELRKVSDSVFAVNVFTVHGDLIQLNQSTEIIVFDELHRANADILSMAAELAATRSMKGTKFPNLKSVVAFFRHDEDADDATLASGFADLAPSLAMDWR